ncbi:hypothetical protein JCM6882_009115 [Rhodosporidiobolus microsporus]
MPSFPLSSSLSTSPTKHAQPPGRSAPAAAAAESSDHPPPPPPPSSSNTHRSAGPSNPSSSFFAPPLASTSTSRGLKEPPSRGGSGSSSGGASSSGGGGGGAGGSASRGTSPSRGGSGDDSMWRSRSGSGGDAYSSSQSGGGSSAPGSRKGSGHEQESTDPGLAGRGAGGYGLDPGLAGRRGSGLPVLNTHLLPLVGGGGGLLSPTGSSNHSHGSDGGGGGYASSSGGNGGGAPGGRLLHGRDSFVREPKPLHPPPLPPSSTSGSTTSPSTTNNSSPAFPRSPSFGPGRPSPTPSPTFPPSHSNSTLSSHSHSHSHSNYGAAPSPTVGSFPSRDFLHWPPSRPGSSASHRSPHPHSHSHHPPSSSGSRSQNPSADGHDPLSLPASTSSSNLVPSRSRTRGDSGGSVESSSSRGVSKEREREKRAVAGGAGASGAAGGGGSQALCAKCELPMTGQFVRALGTVYHLDCFRCMDCNKIVAAKFFPIDDPAGPSGTGTGTGTGSGTGRQVPLCETDYFRRLNLLCSKCGMALRGSYITALDMKFHVEHFTCSVCPTVFGPQDSYYEHAGSVYCHFHYSTRFAVKCTGCRTAILKQFVEINRNNVDEHWHPECYMIHKFWNIKLAPAPKTIDRPPSTADDPPTATPSSSAIVTTSSPSQPPPTTSASSADYLTQEESETPSSLKARQKRMEEQVYRIWTILSAFEESSAACISEMLRHVSGGHYMEGVGMAEKFVLHVETLFAAIDDLNAAFRAAGAKEMAHVREARMLCKKVVNFFMLLSHTHETGARKMSITQELLSLVTGLAHYLKILIRIALTGSLKLEREHANPLAIGLFLGRLDRLARDPEANRISSTTAALARGEMVASPSSTGHDLPPPVPVGGGGGGAGSRKNSAATSDGGRAASSNGGDLSPSTVVSSSGASTSTATPSASASASKKRLPYGYASLTRAVGTLVGQGEATTDLCEGCRLTVEEECARWGTSVRWHLGCLKCAHCGRAASKDGPSSSSAGAASAGEGDAAKEVHVGEFVWVNNGGASPSSGPVALPEDGTVALSGQASAGAGAVTMCRSCASRERGGSLDGTTDGFEYVTRLEQYAFLLCVALNKLFGRLKQRGVVPGSPPDNDETRSLSDAYRDSTDIKRMKSVQLDRKLSSTTARLPKRSTVVQSPSGRTVQSEDSSFALFQAKPPVPSRKDQPLVDPVRGTTIPRPPPSSTSTATTSTAKPSRPTHDHPSSVAAPPPQHGNLPPQRPHYNRATTAVRIVDEPSAHNGGSAEAPYSSRDVVTDEPDGPVLGGASEPTQDEEGLTLADLPKALEAEQKRAVGEQHRRAVGGLPGAAAPGRSSPPSQGGQYGSVRDGPQGHVTFRSEPQLSGGSHQFASASAGPKLLSELSALEYFIVKHVAAVLLASEVSALKDVITLEELLEIIDARKNTFWGKLFKGGEKKKEVKKKGVFGIPLDILVERNGADSMHGAGPGSLRIPSFVDDVISAMKQMDMSIEGIFRKNGNIRRLKDLTEALDRDSSGVNLSDDNPVQLAALLKKFLRDLPDPLMTFKLFHLFIAAQRIPDEAERKKVLHFVCCLMPKHHRDTMEVLFVFLKWVASFSHVDEETGSKMDLQNLATVISPNILYAKGKDPARDESFSAARVVHELLELQDDFWEVPPECLSILNDQELFANPSQLTSKEILARAENHVRVNGRGGWKNSGVHISRGEASAPQRPGLQEAWSAPAVPGSGPGSRPLSTSVSPSSLRPLNDRPLSFSNMGGHPLPHLLQQQHQHSSGVASQPRSGASTPGGAAGWPPAPPPAGRYEDVYRRGGSEGNASSSSLNRLPPQGSPNPHPYGQSVPAQQR